MEDGYVRYAFLFRGVEWSVSSGVDGVVMSRVNRCGDVLEMRFESEETWWNFVNGY